jgi:predicted CXXCH cytochrome family protein
MTPQPPSPRTSRRAASIRHAILFGVLGGGIVSWLGCGTPEQRYKVLSTFFDGVPNPHPATRDSALAGIGVAGAGGARPVLLSVHKPYADKQCQACHDSSNPGPSTNVLTSAPCLTCHESVLNQHPVMHEPVTTRDCLWCHEPHASKFTMLLRTDAAPLCTQCHQRDLLSTNTPEHKSDDVSCLTCHVGHGGSDHALLKPRSR